MQGWELTEIRFPAKCGRSASLGSGHARTTSWLEVVEDGCLGREEILSPGAGRQLLMHRYGVLLVGSPAGLGGDKGKRTIALFLAGG
jgi:hypothetical protein